MPSHLDSPQAMHVMHPERLVTGAPHSLQVDSPASRIPPSDVIRHILWHPGV